LSGYLSLLKSPIRGDYDEILSVSSRK